ncbi:MAG: HD domain-containing protein [Myxococcaceae bacterium]|nr:HD domain-containing protein [Myxococcaceae bacterium]
MASPKDLSKDIATRLAGACHTRRIYAAGSPVWAKAIAVLHADLTAWFQANPGAEVLSLGLVGDSLAVGGVPVVNPPPQVVKLVQQLKGREVEIISFKPQVPESEVEALLGYLSAEAAEVAGVDGNQYLKDRGATKVELQQLNFKKSGVQGARSFRDVFRSGTAAVGRELAKVRTEGTVDVGPMAELAKTMLGFLGSDVPAATLLAMRDRDDHLHVHAMNVALLAGLQARAFGWAEPQVEEVATAGMLHDVGKSRVPEGVLQKRTPLTPTEQALLDHHTTEGARLLLSSSGGDKLPALVAYEHHRPGGPGAERAPVLACQWVAIADAFDSLRTLRPFDTRHQLRGALTWMLEHLGERVSPWLLNRFATLWGYFSVDDMAYLSSGEVVRVVKPHAESARHPTVEVVDTALGQLAPGAVVDLTKPPSTDDGPVSIKLPPAEGFDTVTLAELDQLG